MVRDFLKSAFVLNIYSQLDEKHNDEKKSLEKLQSAVVLIALPLIYFGLAHFAVYLKNSHRKKGRNS